MKVHNLTLVSILQHLPAGGTDTNLSSKLCIVSTQWNANTSTRSYTMYGQHIFLKVVKYRANIVRRTRI